MKYESIPSSSPFYMDSSVQHAALAGDERHHWRNVLSGSSRSNCTSSTGSYSSGDGGEPLFFRDHRIVQCPVYQLTGQQGVLFTNSYGVTHPSEPNYLALFSGSTQGITDDSCPHTFSGPDLGGELISAGLSFSGYS